MKVFFIVQDKNTRSRIKRLQAVRFFSLSNIIFLFRKKDKKKSVLVDLQLDLHLNYLN